jgi:cobaltochelatase CobS
LYHDAIDHNEQRRRDGNLQSYMGRGGIMFLRTALEDKNVPELRELARRHRAEIKVSGLDIAGATKETLILWLSGEKTGTIEQPTIIDVTPTPVEKKEKPIQAQPSNGHNGHGTPDLADAIAQALRGKIEGAMDEGKVQAMIDARLTETAAWIEHKLEEVQPKEPDLAALYDWMGTELNKLREELGGAKRIEVKLPTGTVKEVGRQHKSFEELLKIASMRLDCMLVGPAASGKTFVAESVAKALDLPFYMQPVGSQTTKFDLLGYLDATGKYVTTHLREAYEKGGVFLLDEVDAGNPNVLTVINGMTSNRVGSFPDKMVPRHQDFVLICAANTYGRGADRMYVGRNQLDAATLDRFVVIDWDYDVELEQEISADRKWCGKVNKIRQAVADLKEKMVVSPRASIKGAMLLKAGFSEERVMDMVIFKGINQEVRARVMARVGE